jgi:hypothetical protein
MAWPRSTSRLALRSGANPAGVMKAVRVSWSLPQTGHSGTCAIAPSIVAHEQSLHDVYGRCRWIVCAALGS